MQHSMHVVYGGQWKLASGHWKYMLEFIPSRFEISEVINYNETQIAYFRILLVLLVLICRSCSNLNRSATATETFPREFSEC